MSTVRVALKMPHGLILRLYQMQDHDEPVMGGGHKTVKRAVLRTDVDEVRLNGTAKPWDQPFMTDANGNHVLVVGGYAITPNVDEEFFDEWMEQNRDHDAVRNRLIFSMGSSDTGRARESSGTRSGLEALDVDGKRDPRVPRRVEKMSGKDAAAA